MVKSIIITVNSKYGDIKYDTKKNKVWERGVQNVNLLECV